MQFRTEQLGEPELEGYDVQTLKTPLLDRVDSVIDIVIQSPIECRICGSNDSGNGKLISPCICQGSMSAVHTSCLKHWIDARSGDPMKCEICHTRYQIVMKEVLVCDTKHALSCTSFGHLIFGVVLLFCLACMVGIICVLGPTLTETNASERILLMTLFCVTILMIFLAVKSVWERWSQSSSTSVITNALDLPVTVRRNQILEGRT